MPTVPNNPMNNAGVNDDIRVSRAQLERICYHSQMAINSATISMRNAQHVRDITQGLIQQMNRVQQIPNRAQNSPMPAPNNNNIQVAQARINNNSRRVTSRRSNQNVAPLIDATKQAAGGQGANSLDGGNQAGSVGSSPRRSSRVAAKQIKKP